MVCSPLPSTLSFRWTITPEALLSADNIFSKYNDYEPIILPLNS